MAASRPNKGSVAATGAAALKRAKTTRARDGAWRPDKPFTHEDGLKITMRREKGITTGNVLRVPFRFQAPVLDNFDRAYAFSWSTYDTLRLGQRSRPMGKQLLQLQVNTMLLDGAAADASQGIVVWDAEADPQGMLNELLWIMGKLPGSQPQVFRLVVNQPAVWGDTPLVNMLACMTALTPSQHPSEVGTEYLSATFLEYPEDEQIARKQRPQSTGKTREALRSDDTLYEIAKKSHFHRASAWKAIANANGIKGVSPSSAEELAAWAKRHHKTALTIPAKAA